MEDEVNVMSVTSASRHVGINPSSMLKLLKQGQIKGYKIGPYWVVDKADLEAWNARRKSKKQHEQPGV